TPARPPASRWIAHAAATRTTPSRANRRRLFPARCDLFGQADRGNPVMNVMNVMKVMKIMKAMKAMRAALVVVACVGLAAVAPRVADKVPFAAAPFPLQQVRLLDGPFKQARLLDEHYLLSLDPDRLLHNFRVNAGL